MQDQESNGSQRAKANNQKPENATQEKKRKNLCTRIIIITRTHVAF